MLTPDDRYRRDPVFRTLVDTLELQIRAAHYTPTELREAAILAAIHYESRRLPEPFYFEPLQSLPRRACAACSLREHRSHGNPVTHAANEPCPCDLRGDPATESAGRG